MATSRSTLSRVQIAHALVDLIGAEQVDTTESALREASVDRFKKYSAVHGIFDGPFPAALAYPLSTSDVAAVLRFCDENRVAVVPRTGGTATEGGLETVVADSVVLDCSRMDAILAINPTDMTVTVQCGASLQRVEDTLREQGLTTGHSPQSKPLAQYGGLVATRSIGQFSTLYGGIEDMVVGVEAVLADGTVTRIKNVPRRAAGPDLRHLIIGNEGALAVITEVTVCVFPFFPENDRFFGFLTDDFSAGVEALRELVATGYRPSVVRLYSPEDARQHFADVYQGKCVVILVTQGPEPLAEATATVISRRFARDAFIPLPEQRIRDWFDRLNWGPETIAAEKRQMRETSHLGYTTEVSVSWSRVTELYEAVINRIRTEFAQADDLTMLGAHSSHSYQTGTNLYFVYDYTIRCEPRDEIEVYHKPLNAMIVEEALRVGGSMVHHHGIGKYRTDWTAQEHGTSYELLTRMKTALDPHGIMNPGTIIPLKD